MAIDFIDSETCCVNGGNFIYFMRPNVLRDRFIETVERVGAEKFFSSPKNDIKQARESIAEYFFVLALKKGNGQEWFLMQPKDDPPDFQLMTVSVTNEITLDSFELVEIPPRCQTFEEMMNIVQSKINKKYSENYNLLIFVNHEKSSEWIKLLHEQLKNHSPFKTIWTVHLIWYKGKKDLYGSIVNRLRPYLAKSIKVALNDEVLRKEFLMPNYMEEMRIDGKIFLNFKPDFAKELTKMMRKINIVRLSAKNSKH